jgi:hypothetical protein
MTKEGITMKIVRYALIALAIAPQAWAQPTITFTPANPMTKARAFFTANELPDGKILVAGGYDGSCQCAPNFADSEIYNRDTGIWTATAPMNSARAAAVSARLENRVLVIGGFDENFNVLASAEIYNPRTARWTLTAPMNDARVEDFTAVVLSGEPEGGHRTGKVLVAGGTASDGVTSLSSAEIYDEATNSWTRTGSMNVGRGEYVSVQLLDGQVLAIGGVASDGTALASAEIYDPATGVWTLTGSMSAGRNDAQAVRLRDGRVVVAGGGTGSEDNPRLKSAEIFDPATGQWTATGDMTTPRSEADHAAVLLPHDIMLVPGGLDAPHENVASTDLYNPRTGKWTAGAPMSEPRSGHVALTLKVTRDVIVMGGLDQGPAATASVDIGTAP